MNYDHLPNYILLIILVLGSARASVSIVNDSIFAPIRNIVTLFSPPTETYVNGRWERNENFNESLELSADNPQSIWRQDVVKAGWWGQVISCPDCLGPYVAAFMMFGLHFQKEIFTLILLALSVSMVTSLIARKY